MPWFKPDPSHSMNAVVGIWWQTFCAIYHRSRKSIYYLIAENCHNQLIFADASCASQDFSNTLLSKLCSSAAILKFWLSDSNTLYLFTSENAVGTTINWHVSRDTEAYKPHKSLFRSPTENEDERWPMLVWTMYLCVRAHWLHHWV